MHVRCANPSPSLLVVEVHDVHQFCPISVDGYMARRSDQTNDRESHTESSVGSFLTILCSWEETGRS